MSRVHHLGLREPINSRSEPCHSDKKVHPRLVFLQRSGSPHSRPCLICWRKWIPPATPPASLAVCSFLPAHFAANAFEKSPLLTFQKTCVARLSICSTIHPPHRFAGCLSPSPSPSSWVRPLRRVLPFCNIHVFLCRLRTSRCHGASRGRARTPRRIRCR